MTQPSDSITSGGTHVVSAEILFDLADGTLRHLRAEFITDELTRAMFLAYQRGYADAIRDAAQVVAAKAAQYGVRAAGRGE